MAEYKPSSFVHLPPEILMIIVQEIYNELPRCESLILGRHGRPGVFQLSLTCQKLQQICDPIYYSSVVVGMDYAPCFILLLRRRPHIVDLVRTVNLKSGFEEDQLSLDHEWEAEGRAAISDDTFALKGAEDPQVLHEAIKWSLLRRLPALKSYSFRTDESTRAYLLQYPPNMRMSGDCIQDISVGVVLSSIAGIGQTDGQSQSQAGDSIDNEHTSIDVLSSIVAMFRPDPGLPRLLTMEVSLPMDLALPRISFKTCTTSRQAVAGVRSLLFSTSSEDHIDLLSHLLRSLVGLEQLAMKAWVEFAGPMLQKIFAVMATCEQVRRCLRTFDITVHCGADYRNAIDDINFLSNFSNFERLQSIRSAIWQRNNMLARTAALPPSLETLSLECNRTSDVPGFLDVLTRSAQSGKLPRALRSINVYFEHKFQWDSLPLDPEDVRARRHALKILRSAVASRGVQVHWYETPN